MDEISLLIFVLIGVIDRFILLPKKKILTTKRTHTHTHRGYSNRKFQTKLNTIIISTNTTMWHYFFWFSQQIFGMRKKQRKTHTHTRVPENETSYLVAIFLYVSFIIIICNVFWLLLGFRDTRGEKQEFFFFNFNFHYCKHKSFHLPSVWDRKSVV